MSRFRKALLAAAALMAASPALAEGLGLGRPALPEEIKAWDKAILPNGQGLPPGSGDVATGEEVFGEKCAACHGEFAEGLDAWPVLAGGKGSLKDPRPVKTIGSYWPYLSTVWDYVHRSMPFGSAQTTTPEEAYAITAFLLYSNGVVEDDFVLTDKNFTEVAMPNAGGFYVDDRAQAEYPLFSKEPCMKDCRKAPAQITKRAIELNVTPKDDDGKPAGTLPPVGPVVAEAPAPEPAPEPAVRAPQPKAKLEGEALIAAGKEVFTACAACHNIGENAHNATGPQLNGVLGRKAATVQGFNYSPAMLEAGKQGLTWDAETLYTYLADPKALIPKTKMPFHGIPEEEPRKALIAYFKSLQK